MRMRRLYLALFQSIVSTGIGTPKTRFVCRACVPRRIWQRKQVMTRKGVGKVRHTPEQIAAKLGEAETLAAAGKTQSEICKALGISVMTFHRWRHAQVQRLTAAAHNRGAELQPSADTPSDPASLARIAELQLENARLRKLVTDLLLKKIKLQEDISPTAPSPGDDLAALQNLLR
jgi:putative transposase